MDKVESDGFPYQRVALGGFSQGACLTLEYVRRYPKQYGGVFGLSGGLIGPTAGVPHPDAKLEDTPVFLGCSDIDPYIPAERVRDSAKVLETMDARVEMMLYAGMAHTIIEDEVQKVRAIIERMLE